MPKIILLEERSLVLERVAVVELKTTCVKLQIVDVIRNKYFQNRKTIEMPINLTKDFYGDMFIKPTVIKEINSILGIFKRIIEDFECSETICVATDFLSEAKNLNGFLNELLVSNGFDFKVFSPESEIDDVYTAVINSFNRPKGIIVNISDYNSELVLYNRRNILKKIVVPYGAVKVNDKLDNLSYDEKIETIKKEIQKLIEESDFKSELPEEFDIIGAGDAFKDYGIVCRKAKKYPLDLSHNFVSTKADLEKVYGLIKNLDMSTSTKIKGLKLNNSKYFPGGLSIIKAVIDCFEKDEFAISSLGATDGMLFHNVLPLTLEKPISDTLGYSLQVLNDYFDPKPNNSLHIYEISMVLFKQLKVLHKLPRPYVKVLRIASYLSNSGFRINIDNADKIAYDVIKNSEIYGVNHTDIILASFVALGKNSDNFNLSEWVRFKEYVTEEDLIAVKKLSVILKIAEALDITGFGNVTDISCDILGDSVIMKTIVKEDSAFEISYAMLCGSEFKKAFGKNLEVL